MKDGNAGVPKGAEVPEKPSAADEGDGGAADVLLRDVPPVLHSKQGKHKGASDSRESAGEAGSAEGPPKENWLTPKDFRVATNVDWHNIPMEHGEEYLRLLRLSYEQGIIILRERMRTMPVTSDCHICKTPIPDGRWVGRFVSKDPDTQLNKIEVICSDKCYNVYKYSLSAGSPKSPVGVRT